MTSPSLPLDAHARTADDVARGLAVDPSLGLDPTEAARRAETDGQNVLEAERPAPVWRLVLRAASEPFVILLIISAVLAVLLGQVRDGLLVLIALLPIVGADVFTEYRSERALEALRAASTPTCRVRRGGTVLDIPSVDLVSRATSSCCGPGTWSRPTCGCGGAEGLLLDRSILTGESVPEPGRVAPDPAATELSERGSLAYSGTSVVGGRGEGIVVAIGGATEVGRIAGSIASEERRRSPLQRELDRLVRILLVVALGLIAYVTLAGVLRGRTLGENLLAGISAAIAAIPEEPPILLAVILGLGAYRLLRRGVLVRRLNAEETLGAVDLIVTDKTGTLTRNRLEVASIRGLDGPVDGPDGPASAPRRRPARGGGRVASRRRRPPGLVHGRHRSGARRAGRVAVARCERSHRPAPPPVTGARSPRTRARRDGHVEELCLGAPEAVLDLVGSTDPSVDRAGWLAAVDAGAEAGERLVLLARRSDERPWAMRALVGFADPLRPGVGDALAMARGAGLQTLIVTGDHPRTAAAIARAAGLDFDRVATGAELAGWSDERLARELGGLHIVARSTPDQKERIVRAARADRRVVAVTGDGVNDAPALHGADVAVAMGSGTAVAREASDLVLGDDSFATLVFGIAEGRKIVDNVQKGLVFLVSTHVALLGFLLIATTFGFDQPLLPLQILWLELFIDLSTSIAFEREPAEPDLMTRPPRPAHRPLLDNGLLLRLAVAGGYSAVAALVLLANHGGGAEHARWLAYTALVVSQAIRAYANRSIRGPVHRLRPNGFLLAACIAVIAVQAVIPYVPALAVAFHATPLYASDWALVAIVAILPALLAETVRTLRPGVRWVA